jgi:hypothetical protein
MAGLALGAKGIKDLLGNKKTKGWEGWGGRGTLGIATGGLSEVARAFGLGGHKSTKEHQKDRWGKLDDTGKSYYESQQAQKAADPNSGTWQSGKYAGQKWDFDKAADLAKDDPTHFVGNLGNFEAFGGQQWGQTPLDKQKEVVSQLLGNNLYYSSKGDVRISDKDRAKQIYDSIMNPQQLQGV